MNFSKLEVRVYFGGCLVLQGPSYSNEPELGVRVAESGSFDEWQLVVLLDDADPAKSTETFLWATWTRFDPARHIHARETVLQDNHIKYSGPIVIDARRNRHDRPRHLMSATACAMPILTLRRTITRKARYESPS